MNFNFQLFTKITILATDSYLSYIRGVERTFFDTWTWDSCGSQSNGLFFCVTFRDMICARRTQLPASIVIALITAFLERFHCSARGLSFAESSPRASCSDFHLARANQPIRKINLFKNHYTWLLHFPPGSCKSRRVRGRRKRLRWTQIWR